jgi:hypothetical protein
MKKRLAAAAFAVAAVVAVASPAFADAGGVPNNCVGKVTSYTAGGNDISPFVSAHGIGNVATANGASVKEVMWYLKNVLCG